MEQFTSTLNYIGVASSVRILSSASSLLPKSMAFIELTKTGLDYIFNDPAVITTLKQSDEGEEFLKYWQIASVVIDVATIGTDILDGIIENGTKASNSLRIAGKTDAADNVDDLVLEAKIIKSGDNFVVELISSFKTQSGINVKEAVDEDLLRTVKNWQGSGVYTGVDEWVIVEIPAGTKVFGGLPGSSEFYTINKTITDANYDKVRIWESLQVKASDVFGYRPKMGEYEIKETIKVAIAKTNANLQFGEGGAWQIFIENYDDKIKLTKEIDLQ